MRVANRAGTPSQCQICWCRVQSYGRETPQRPRRCTGAVGRGRVQSPWSSADMKGKDILRPRNVGVLRPSNPTGMLVHAVQSCTTGNPPPLPPEAANQLEVMVYGTQDSHAWLTESLPHCMVSVLNALYHVDSAFRLLPCVLCNLLRGDLCLRGARKGTRRAERRKNPDFPYHPPNPTNIVQARPLLRGGGGLGDPLPCAMAWSSPPALSKALVQALSNIALHKRNSRRPVVCVVFSGLSRTADPCVAPNHVFLLASTRAQAPVTVLSSIGGASLWRYQWTGRSGRPL